MKAVPYLKLLAKLKDGSMNVMEDQGYVFDGGKAIWINPQSAARRSVTQKVIFGWSVQGEDAE